MNENQELQNLLNEALSIMVQQNTSAAEPDNVFNEEPDITEDTSEQKRTYKTCPEDVIKNLPARQATITSKDFAYACSFNRQGDAFLAVSKPNDSNTPNTSDMPEKKSQNETIASQTENILSGITAKDEVREYDGKTSSLPETYIKSIKLANAGEINLSYLRFFYTLILEDYKRANFQNIHEGHVIKLYMPSLLRACGRDARLNQGQIDAMIASILQYSSLIGCIASKRGGYSAYPLLSFLGYDDDTNTISFSSPYLDHLALTILASSIERDKNKKVLKDKNGNIKFLPSHSYLIKSSIANEKNFAAVENVNIIIQIIEQAGSYIPHVSAKTLIDRNVSLQCQLKNTKKRNRQRVLDRCFKKTWELLKTQTILEETYEDIILPDPEDKSNLPNIHYLDQTFTFPHGEKGNKTKKVKDNSEEENKY